MSGPPVAACPPYPQRMAGEPGEDQASSSADAAATLREVLRQVEDGQLAAAPGLVRRIEGAVLAFEEQERLRHRTEDGTEPDG